ncbi:MAG: rhomboid family intramembrane serine protease, partial [Acidimicrobiales bacterium]
MATATCYRHTDRTTGASCTRCARPICPDCMIQAPVGHHCPTCVQEARADMRKVQRVRYPSGPGIRLGAVCGALIAVNVAVFMVDLGDPEITRRFADNAVLVANRDEYYRMLTAAFLHAGLLHLAFNMFGLYAFGSQLEQVVGAPRFLALYLLSALGGSACSHFFGPPFTYG